MVRIKVTVVIEEPYQYRYSEAHPIEDRIRDVKLYEQIVYRSGEPNDNPQGLVADIAAIVNGIKK